jgi:NAD(P)-dependent dehydrogenase (short-subunit alcohol dehydrogenase family)
MKDLKDRTALVTGSTSGIGRATALVLAARGARVLVTGRNEQRAASVVAEIESGGGTAAYRLTALDGAAAARDLAAWAAEAGDALVDILVNNTGVAPAGPTESATEAESTRPSLSTSRSRSSSSRPWHPPCPHAVTAPSSAPPPWSPASASRAWQSTGQAAPPSNC